ncbi:MAG: hypothetical protein AAGJ19_21945 [Myxococcota bacterium]
MTGLMLGGCTVDDPVAELVGDGGDLGPTSDFGGQDLGVLDRPGCDAQASVLAWDGASAPFGLCICGDLTSSSPLEVLNSAAVGGQTSLEATTRLGRGLWLSRGLSATAPADLEVRELYAREEVQSDGTIQVRRFMGAGGDVRAARVEAPLGLSLPAGANLDVGTLDGPLLRGPGPVFQGCECGPVSDPLAGEGVGSSALVGDVDLACGPLQSGPLTLDQASRWTVDGPTQLRLEGDANLDANLTVERAAGASGARLDLVVEGNLVSAGRLLLGEPETPVNLRILGGGTVQLSGETVIYGDLDAPSARLVVSTGLEVQGRLRVASVSASGSIQVFGADGVPGLGRSCEDDFGCRAPLVCADSRCASEP